MNRGVKSWVAFLVLALFSLASADPDIFCQTTDLGNHRWQYDFTVQNNWLVQPIEEFTIDFDYGRYGNLAMESSSEIKANWDEIILPEDTVIKEGYAYDALVINNPILPGEFQSGFAVSFDYYGVGAPSCVLEYDIVDPVSFDVLFSGHTIPEPATLSLITLGCLFLSRRKKRVI